MQIFDVGDVFAHCFNGTDAYDDEGRDDEVEMELQSLE